MQPAPQSFSQPTVRRRSRRRLLCLLGLVLLALSPLSLASTPALAQTQPQKLEHTPWQMSRMAEKDIKPIPAGIDISSSAVLNLFQSTIPPEKHSSWGPAPLDSNGRSIAFSPGSRLKGCQEQFDVSYFQAFLTIPKGSRLTAASVHIDEVDDYARVYVFNKSNPKGKYYQEHDLLPPGAQQGADFELKATDFVVGEPNRIVIVQIDFCAPGNTLRNAKIEINGGEVPAASAPLKLDPWQISRAKDIVALANGVQIRTASILDQASKTIPAQNAKDWLLVKDSKEASITVEPQTGQERLKFDIRSRLKTGECNKKLDFTYFQTFVTVPPKFTLTKAQVVMPIVDDYARVYVYTPADSKTPQFNPAGDVISPDRKKGETPLDISKYLKAGQKSRIVIVHVDHCAPGSTLFNAFITVEGR